MVWSDKVLRRELKKSLLFIKVAKLLVMNQKNMMFEIVLFFWVFFNLILLLVGEREKERLYIYILGYCLTCLEEEPTLIKYNFRLLHFKR